MVRRKGLWIVLALLGAVAVAGCATAQDGESGSETILVTGYGEARGNPDIATLNIGVNVANTGIDAAVEESNETVARITAALTGMGILEADIQTTNFNVWREDIYSPETGQVTGEYRYHVDSSVQVNVREISRASEVLKVAIQNGANNIYGPSFAIDNTDTLAAQARAAAVADARARAEQVAAELGVTLGEVMSVKEVSGGPVYAYFAGAGYGGGGGEGPPISEGSLTVNIQLEVSFAFVR
ncbi:MAG TPA: SIMPL domain-containing protein [Anaerolineales bacterium]